ncbi:MAG: RING finger protein [Thermoplasmata archaeon]
MEVIELPDPRISPYKLSRDLEEKAKEAKKRKEQLDSLIPRYRMIVEAFKDSIPSEILSEFYQAEKLYNDKEFYESWDHFSKAKEGIDSILGKIIEKKIDELRSFKSYPFLRDKFLDDLISKAPGDPVEFIKFYNDTLETIKVKVKESIVSISPPELNSEIFRRYGREITGLLTLDLPTLRKILDDITKIVRSYFMGRLNLLMEKMDNFKDAYSRLKISTAHFTAMNEEVLSLIREDRYQEAIEKLEKFTADVEETLKNVLKKLLDTTEKSIDEVSGLGADLSKVKENLSVARDLLAKNEYRRVIDLIRDINGDIERARLSILDEKINIVKERIQRAKEENFDVGDVTKLFEKTRALINRRQIQEALDSLDEIIRILDGMQKERDYVLRHIDELEKNARILEVLGLNVSPEDLRRIREVAIRDPRQGRRDIESYEKALLNAYQDRKETLIGNLRAIIESLESLGIQGTWGVELETAGEMDMLDLARRINGILENIKSSIKSFMNIYFSGNAEIISATNDFIGMLEKNDFAGAVRYLEVLNNMVMNQRQSMIKEKVEEVKEILRLISGHGADVSAISSEIDSILSANMEFDDKVKILSGIYESIKNGIQDPINLYIQFTDNVIKLLNDKRLKVSEDLLKARSGIDSFPRSVDRFKNSGYLDSLAFNAITNTLTILAEIDLIDKKFGGRIAGISNDINFLRKDLEDLKYDEVREEFEKIIENLEAEIIKNGFRELRGMIGYLEEIKSTTGLYRDLLPQPDLTVLQNINLPKMYQDVENALEDFRHRIFSDIMDLSSRLIVKELFREQISTIIDNYTERDYLAAWRNIIGLRERISGIEAQYMEAKRILESLEKNVIIFENLGFRLEKSRGIIDELRKILERLDFKEFMESYRARYLEVRNEIYNVLNNYIGVIEEKMNSLRGKRNVLIAEGLITSAKRAIKLDQFEETVKYIFDAVEDLQVDDIVKQVSSNLLKRVKNVVEIFGALRPKDLVEGLARANLYLGQGKYSNAVFELNSLLIKYEEMSKSVEDIKKMIEDVKEKISSAVILGINTQEFLKNYQASRLYLQGGQIEKSLESISSLGRNLDVQIEDTVSREMKALYYLSGISDYLGLNMKNLYNSAKERSMDIISILVLRKNDSISRAVQDYRKAVDEIMKRRADVERSLKERMDNIWRIAVNFGLPGFTDHQFILELWNNRQYVMLYDFLPMAESKVLRNYVQSFSSFLGEELGTIIRNSHFTQDVYASLNQTYSIYSGAGDLDPLQAVDAIKSYSDNVYAEAYRNLSSRIGNIREGNDLFLPYYDYIARGFLNSYEKILGNYLEERRSRILEVARTNGIEVKPFELKELRIDKVIGHLISLENEVNEKLKMLRHISDMELNMESDGNNIRGRVDLEYRGKEDVKKLILRLSGVTENITIDFGGMRKGERRSHEISSRVQDSNVLRITLDYDGERKEREMEADLQIKRGFTSLKASGTEKCVLCRGRIFRDLDMVICEKCGATYHYQCAKRAGKCLSCGNRFDFTEKKSMGVKISL